MLVRESLVRLESGPCNTCSDITNLGVNKEKADVTREEIGRWKPRELRADAVLFMPAELRVRKGGFFVYHCFLLFVLGLTAGKKVSVMRKC